MFLGVGGFVVIFSVFRWIVDRPTVCKRPPDLIVATAIETAADNFEVEYGRMPARGDTDIIYRTDQDIPFLLALLGMEAGPDRLNTGSFKFLSVKEGKGKEGGLIYTEDGKSVAGLFDRWGGPYFVMLDLDGDGKVEIPKGPVLQRRTAVWTNGPDGKPGGGDDLQTW
ncbi:MAG: hypothetical protein KDN05_10890 [Verrucomicrobiae bacterium]|nr:hypothetical protein [Verrucomicrobiae bacterium]